MIFNTVLWHSSSMYLGSEGQRYTLTRIYGRADHPWEGVVRGMGIDSALPRPVVCMEGLIWAQCLDRIGLLHECREQPPLAQVCE